MKPVRVNRHQRRVYAYTTRSHDYDPTWDYPVIRTPSDVRPMLKEIRQQLTDDLLPRLGIFRSFTIHVAEELPGSSVAIYANGTVSQPVVVIDAEEHRALAKEINMSRSEERRSLTVSIVHELGHAVQEAHGLENDEEWAEEFARRYVDTGEILPIVGVDKLKDFS